MNPTNEFISRNIDTYIKTANVPEDIINKYKSLLPEELIYIWKKMGFGIYENGFLQLINPEEFNFIFEYIDILLEPRMPLVYNEWLTLFLHNKRSLSL
ncbi:GAD-like domain-containing protein [Pasteurella sp. PK-2025]|uniref:GAD-like domain-containing protein n=1 Tax=unclassified Pasteurella TaxID=2621516 RepID=UPI003C76650F